MHAFFQTVKAPILLLRVMQELDNKEKSETSMRAEMESQITAQRKVHPEHESGLSFMLRSWVNAFFRPKIRLHNEFPWGLKDFTKIYAVAAFYYLVGSLVPIVVVFGAIWVGLQIAPDQVLPMVADAEGHPNSTVLLVATLTSFVSGFGAELFYFNKQLRKVGNSLGKLIGLNLNSLNGSWPEAIKRSFIALVIAICLQNAMDLLPLPHPQQATADMAAHLNGIGLVSFGILAAILAPFFEEIVFRGCVFNAFRHIFREGRIFNFLKKNHRLADYSAVALSAAIFAAAHLDITAFPQLFVLGVVMAELYRRTGTLICPIMLHAANNFVATMLIATSR